VGVEPASKPQTNDLTMPDDVVAGLINELKRIEIVCTLITNEPRI
jgi:hypothetical protein